MTDKQTDLFLHNIAEMRIALQGIRNVLFCITDPDKKILRTVDVERSEVYKTHLGKKLK